MSKDAWEARRVAFEAHYFGKLSDDKVKALKSKLTQQHDMEELQKQTGIRDEELLNQLLIKGITAAEITTLALFPIAYVAWADGKIEDKEKAAIIKACKEYGITEDSASMELMESWLETPMEDELFNLWKAWVHAILPRMDKTHAQAFGNSIKAKTIAVAKSSSSFLGLGPAISGSEQEVIDKVEHVLAI